jgi:FKBP-type peptidyl-prolyl cis-trans isomerase FkpA
MKRNCAKLSTEMRKVTIVSALYLGLSLVLSFCAQQESVNKSAGNSPQRDLVPVNKYLVKKNQQNIVNFVNRKEWNMRETPTGLWFMIYENGHGSKGVQGKAISISYSVSLLDGTLCYSSDSLGLKSFRIGSGHVEAGLEEAALLLHEGDKARIIMPPHLAYGLLGDNNKIPAQSIILYDLTVVQIK